MNATEISNALKSANIEFDRVRKHNADNVFRINKVGDVAAATHVLHAIEGAKCDVDGDKITVTLEAAAATEVPAEKLDPATAEGQLALQGNAGSRAKNPGYEEVFDLAIEAIKAGDTLKDWKAGRRVRMMQTIRKCYAPQFEQRGRNVVFTGDVKDIDKSVVLASLGLKTNRSLPAKATEAAAA